MKFDGTVSLGTILEIIVFVGIFFKLYGDFREIKLKVDSMWLVFMKEHHLEIEE